MTKPDKVTIGLWQKLDDQMYRIGLNDDIDSMGNYYLKRKKFNKNGIEVEDD